MTMEETVGAALVATSESYATNSPQGRKQAAEMAERAAVGAHGNPTEYIGNTADPATANASHFIHAAAIMQAATETTIYNGKFVGMVEIRERREQRPELQAILQSQSKEGGTKQWQEYSEKRC